MCAMCDQMLSIEITLFGLMAVSCLYGTGMMVWWWRKVGKATRVYLFTLLVFFGIAVGSLLRIGILTHHLHEVWGALIPIAIVAGVIPMCFRMTRRAWVFSHATEEEVQEQLKVMVCPLLGIYCAHLAQKGKEEAYAKTDQSKT